jgi:PAS domain S-box-containing protein
MAERRDKGKGTVRKERKMDSRRPEAAVSPVALPAPWLQLLGGQARGDRETSELLTSKDEIYRLVTENATDVVWVMDMSGRYMYFSPSVLRLTGYSIEEIVANPIRVMNGAGIGYVRGAIEEQLRLQKTGKKEGSKPMELELTRKDGSRVWTETTWSLLLNSDGKPAAIIGAVRDITERKRAEDLFRTLADNSPVSIYIVQDGRFRFLNRHFLMETVCTADELIGDKPLRRLAPRERHRVAQQAAAMLDGLRSEPYEFRYVGRKGQTRWVIERVARIQYEGRPAILGIFMDITERKRSEEALKRSESELRLLSQRMLQIQEDERARIARDLHDQLGQELVFLKIKAQSLAEQVGPASVAYDAAAELASLIDRVKATSHRIALSIRPDILDGLGLVKAIQWYAGEFELQTSIACFVDVPVDDVEVPKNVATAAYRILQEALTNVFKHASATEVHVVVEIKAKVLTVRISDNGKGFDSDSLSERASLGLIGMRERARLVGGSLKVSTRRPAGTRVVARLPLVEADSAVTLTHAGVTGTRGRGRIRGKA